ncbi:MAG: hypothetical protein ACK5ZG_15735 [Phycisphaerae bacterium]|jgi:hypothetical protein
MNDSRGPFRPALQSEDDAQLVTAYVAVGMPVDALPYTPEFDHLMQMVGRSDKRAVFQRLLLLRKSGQLPHAVRKPTPIESPFNEIEIESLHAAVADVLGSTGLRDRLPYSPEFDRILTQAQSLIGVEATPLQVWRAISTRARWGGTIACPPIPLALKRRSELRDELDKYLSHDVETPLEAIYNHVLATFGPSDCQPDVLCPHYSAPHPEYRHLVRHALRDGKDDGRYENPRRGYWKLVK